MNDQSAVHNARALPDVETIRRNARKDIEEGAITSAYTADREQVIKLLNEALATEIICTLRYRHDYFVARGIKAKVVAEELLEHANQELEHADSIAERILRELVRMPGAVRRTSPTGDSLHSYRAATPETVE